jgi:adenine-specific DNA-methyltransferase
MSSPLSFSIKTASQNTSFGSGVSAPPREVFEFQQQTPAETAHTSREARRELGQFFTPAPVAAFMASLFDNLPQTIRLLDAGAGIGTLTKAFAEHCAQNQAPVRAIETTLYERDVCLLPALAKTLRECEHFCAQAGIRFTHTVHHTDFIHAAATHAADADTLFSATRTAAQFPQFDAAIVNPPYRKITANSAERRALRAANIETSNLYTGFLALIQRLLAPAGQLVALTPRSFCNGPYFRTFRETFLDEMNLRRLHVFDSRKTTFQTDGVLQENIIFHAEKKRTKNTTPHNVLVSGGDSIPTEDTSCGIPRPVPFGEIVHPGDTQRFIHIPSTAAHTTALREMDTLHASLATLGVNVATGRVVNFRLKEFLRNDPGHDTVPLLHPCHFTRENRAETKTIFDFNSGTIVWPKPASRKPNAILDTPQTRSALVPTGIYLLTKRFTAKEERRRLVACLFDPAQITAERIGFENHLNYFHASGHGLERNLAAGLFVFLNSTMVDQYFRRFSGHTQVNAADLRSLPYPDRNTILAMGNELNTQLTAQQPNISQETIDQLVQKHLAHAND